MENFKKNYIQEKCKSLTLNSVFCLSGIATAKVSFNYGIFSSASLTSFIAMGTLAFAWNKWSSRPYDLALFAYQSMSQRNEKVALEAINQGANIYQNFSHLDIKGRRNPNLFIQAAEFGCIEVIKLLASLGWNLDESASTIGRAPNIETVQLLVELGANINLYNGYQSSPLWIQLARFSIYLSKEQSSEKDLLNYFENKCQVIEFLLDKGAKLQNNSSKFNEKARVEELFNKIFEKLEKLPTNDLKRKENVLNRLQKIQNKL